MSGPKDVVAAGACPRGILPRLPSPGRPVLIADGYFTWVVSGLPFSATKKARVFAGVVARFLFS